MQIEALILLALSAWLLLLLLSALEAHRWRRKLKRFVYRRFTGRRIRRRKCISSSPDTLVKQHRRVLPADANIRSTRQS